MNAPDEDTVRAVRRARGAAFITMYAATLNVDGPPDVAFGDLIADLCHGADALGFDPQEAADSGFHHYMEERDGGPPLGAEPQPEPEPEEVFPCPVCGANKGQPHDGYVHDSLEVPRPVGPGEGPGT